VISVDIANEDEETPLHLAIALGYEQIAQQLVHFGSSLYETDEEGNTPLHVACTESLGLVRHLVENGADVNARNSNKQTALHLAAMIQNSALVEYLLSHGACEDVIDIYGQRPVDYFKPMKKSPARIHELQWMPSHCAPKVSSYLPVSEPFTFIV